MKTFVGVIVLFALCSLALAQDAAQPIERCLEGSSTNGVGNFSLELCDLSSRRYSCESRISVHGDNLYVERKCKQRMACLNNQKNNDNQCYSQDAINKQNRVCYYCCEEDVCNDFDTIIPLTPPTIATPEPDSVDNLEDDEFDL